MSKLEQTSVNNFCKFLSNGVSINKNGSNYNVTPCCWYKQENTVRDLSINSIEKARDQYRHITGWTDGCSACQALESKNGTSYRQSSFDLVKTDNNKIQSLEIMLHNACGAACIICNPNSSSSWHKELKKQNIKSKQFPYMFDQIEFDNLFTNDFTDLKQIKFWGGEPFINELHAKFLEQVPNKQDCEIHYTVSGQSVPSQQAYDLMSQFKLVKIEVSIDGIEDQFEYQRWPIKWHDFVSNLNTMRELSPVNTLFRFNHTLNPLNAYYYNRLEDWVTNNFNSNRLGDPTEINVHPCWGIMDLNKTPTGIVLDASVKNDQVQGMLNSVKYTEHQTMINHCEFWDKVRNLNWKNTFPEVVKYFE